MQMVQYGPLSVLIEADAAVALIDGNLNNNDQ